MDTAREAWYEGQLQEAHAVATHVAGTRDRIRELPSTGPEMAQTDSLAKLNDALPLSIAKGLDPLQHQAAMLLGGGFTFADAAKALGVPVDDVHRWHTDLPEYRKAMRYYKTVRETEIGGQVLKEISILLKREDLSPKDMIGLLRVMQQVGLQPEVRAAKDADLMLRYEQLQIQKGEGQRVVEGLKYAPTEAIEGEFSVVDETASDTQV
jgi:hypothetical protein